MSDTLARNSYEEYEILAGNVINCAFRREACRCLKRCIDDCKDMSKEDIQKNMYEMAKAHLESHTFAAASIAEMEDILDRKTGFVKAMWCGDSACEDKIKDVTGGVKSRCIPFEEENLGDTCACCGRPAKHMVYWGKQY